MDERSIRSILGHGPTVAVLGAHHEPDRPAFYVPDYLHGQGYRIVPVNPQLAGTTLWGAPVLASLTEIGEPVDVVDVFRRAEALPAHVADILGMQPLPPVVWFQLGIRNDAVAHRLEAAGITVVQDRCMLADHRRFGLGRPVRTSTGSAPA